VMATGHMLDRIEGGGQKYALFQLQEKQSGEDDITVKNEAGEDVYGHLPVNDYSVLIYSSPELTEGAYTLWSGDTQLSVSTDGRMGGFGGRMPPPGGKPPELPEDFDPTKLPPFPRNDKEQKERA